MVENLNTTVPELPALLNTAQFADLIGYHRESVRRLVRDGLVEALRFGRSYRIPRTVAERILEEGLPTVPRR